MFSVDYMEYSRNPRACVQLFQAENIWKEEIEVVSMS